MAHPLGRMWEEAEQRRVMQEKLAPLTRRLVMEVLLYGTATVGADEVAKALAD